jgi:nucleotide-binding universal stress UspA family protein
MKNIQRIIVCIDFSIYSPEIIEYAAGVAERNSAEIVAVNVINQRLIESLKKEFAVSDFHTFSLDKFIADEIRKRTLNLDDLIKKYVSDNIPTRISIKSGVPYEEILKVVDDENADLLVISSKGRTNFHDYMFGTTAEKIFRHSPVSVLSLNLRK